MCVSRMTRRLATALAIGVTDGNWETEFGHTLQGNHKAAREVPVFYATSLAKADWAGRLAQAGSDPKRSRGNQNRVLPSARDVKANERADATGVDLGYSGGNNE